MKRIAAFTLLIAAALFCIVPVSTYSQSLARNVTVPPAPNGAQAPYVIYNNQLTAAVASISATPLVTVPANGTYRISITGTTTVVGTGATSSLGYHTVTATFTDPSASGSVTQALGVLTLGTGSNYNGVLGNTPLTTGPGFLVFRAKAGTAISLTTTLTAAGGSPAPEPNIVITPIIESLGL